MANKLSGGDFDLVNYDKTYVIYRTDDPAKNRLTFSIINKTGADLALTGGAPVQHGMPGGSSFNFNFESMLTDDVVKNMKITLPGSWAQVYFPSTGQGVAPSWSVAPAKDLTIKAGDVVQILLENISCATTQPGNFEIMYTNILGYRDNSFPIMIHLAVINPVDPAKDNLPIVPSYKDVIHPIQGETFRVPEEKGERTPAGDTPVNVYISYDPKAYIQNGFTYLLYNTKTDPLIPQEFDAGNLPDGDKPVVYISFLFGDAFNDLTVITSQILADNNLSIGVTADPPWTSKGHSSNSAYWKFFPSNVVIGGHETISFPISKIMTDINIPEYVSCMYVQINNIPKYNDCNYFLLLAKKEARVSAGPIMAEPTTLQKFGDNVKLTWTTSLATRVTLEYADRCGNMIVLDSANGEISLNAKGFQPKKPPTAEHTTLTLTAYGKDPDKATAQVVVTVPQPEAEIISFAANPQLADISGQVCITFNWTVTDAHRVTITTPEQVVDVTDQTQYVYPSLTATSSFTLSAYAFGTSHPAPATQTLRVYAYKPTPPIPLPFVGEAMQTFPTVLVNNNFNRVYIADAGNNTICDINVITGGTNPPYPGTVFAIGGKGSKLFVYNPDNNNFGVSIIDVGTGVKSGPYGFGPVYQMIATPDLSNLYCAATHNVNTVTQLAINVGANTLTFVKNIIVGQSPRAMVFNKDNTKLYVANYDEQSVSVIKVSDGSVTNITITPAEPVSFAYHQGLDLLYVACEGANMVSVIDTINDKETGTITVGNRPVTALLSPNGAFLYVANFGESSVSVYDTATKAVSTLQVGGNPICMALNADSNVLFVGSYCAKTLSIIDIKKNVVLPQTLSTGDTAGNPFDIAVYTEGNDYTRVYVAKEVFSKRLRECTTTSSSLDVSVYSVQKPQGRGSETTISENNKSTEDECL